MGQKWETIYHKIPKNGPNNPIVFIDFQKYWKLVKIDKIWPKNTDFVCVFASFFRASSSTESFVAAHTDAPNGLLFGRNVPLGIFTTTSNLDFGIFLEFI